MIALPLGLLRRWVEIIRVSTWNSSVSAGCAKQTEFMFNYIALAFLKC